MHAGTPSGRSASSPAARTAQSDTALIRSYHAAKRDAQSRARTSFISLTAGSLEAAFTFAISSSPSGRSIRSLVRCASAERRMNYM